MVLRDGFRRTRFLRFPACQSTYSVESAVAQNFLSSSSFLNSGSFFFISLIGRRFVPVHVSGRNHSYELPPDREDYEQLPARTRLPEGVVSLLPLRMAKIAAHHEWLMKEYVLGLLRSYPMPFPVLVGIGVVPVKPEAILQRIHCCHKPSIRPSYTSRPAHTPIAVRSGLGGRGSHGILPGTAKRVPAEVRGTRALAWRVHSWGREVPGAEKTWAPTRRRCSRPKELGPQGSGRPALSYRLAPPATMAGSWTNLPPRSCSRRRPPQSCSCPR